MTVVSFLSVDRREGGTFFYYQSDSNTHGASESSFNFDRLSNVGKVILLPLYGITILRGGKCNTTCQLLLDLQWSVHVLEQELE